jgi:hypothetical protein
MKALCGGCRGSKRWSRSACRSMHLPRASTVVGQSKEGKVTGLCAGYRRSAGVVRRGFGRHRAHLSRSQLAPTRKQRYCRRFQVLVAVRPPQRGGRKVTRGLYRRKARGILPVQRVERCLQAGTKRGAGSRRCARSYKSMVLPRL